MTLTLTPWARAAIRPDDLAAIRARIPADHELRIGGRGRDWSAYLVTGQGCLASVQHAVSWRAAVDAVLEGVPL